jgi:DNA-binding transcriptional LysR family regulator
MAEWDLRKLRILHTLRERGTVTATAEALHMTPSAVSQQLTNLSRQLGVPLLEAQGRRVRLTDAARLVLRHADAVFEQVERADAALAAYRDGEAGEVRVGAFSTAVPALVVPAVRALRTTHPAVTVHVREAEAAEAYDLLAAGEVDLALSLAAEAPGTCPADLRGPATPGTPSRRTPESPKYVQYEGDPGARREHAPDAAGCSTKIRRTGPWSCPELPACPAGPKSGGVADTPATPPPRITRGGGSRPGLSYGCFCLDRQ